MNIGFCSAEGHILSPELYNLLAKIYLGVLPRGFLFWYKVNVLANKWVEQINKKDWQIILSKSWS